MTCLCDSVAINNFYLAHSVLELCLLARTNTHIIFMNIYKKNPLQKS